MYTMVSLSFSLSLSPLKHIGLALARVIGLRVTGLNLRQHILSDWTDSRKFLPRMDI